MLVTEEEWHMSAINEKTGREWHEEGNIYPNVTYVLWREVAALTRRLDELEHIVSERVLHEKTFSTQNWAEHQPTQNKIDNGTN